MTYSGRLYCLMLRILSLGKYLIVLYIISLCYARCMILENEMYIQLVQVIHRKRDRCMCNGNTSDIKLKTKEKTWKILD